MFNLLVSRKCQGIKSVYKSGSLEHIHFLGDLGPCIPSGNVIGDPKNKIINATRLCYIKSTCPPPHPLIYHFVRYLQPGLRKKRTIFINFLHLGFLRKQQNAFVGLQSS